jgi:hypothetical protein
MGRGSQQAAAENGSLSGRVSLDSAWVRADDTPIEHGLAHAWAELMDKFAPLQMFIANAAG